MALCKRCQNFDIQAFARGCFPRRGYPIASFIRAAKAGCSFCSLLLEQFLVADRGNKLKYLSIELRKQSGEWADVKWLSGEGFTLFQRWLTTVLAPVWVHSSVTRGALLPSRGTEALNIVGLNAFVSPFSNSNQNISGYTHTIELHLGADADTPAATSQDITGRPAVEQYTWSTSHIEAVAAWHRNCKANHTECNQTLSRAQSFNVDDVALPTRCVEIMRDDTGPPLGFLLRETAGMRGKYIALSHRWGDSVHATRTTLGNYASRLAHPHWPTPLALDAALHAQTLGVRYVWIDSWCIVQDDAADWARESVRMADYYQRAWLTVSATTVSSTGGLLGAVPPELMPALARLPYRGRDGVRQGYFYAQCFGEDKLAGDYVQHVSKSALLRRGWVYQEWMLSRRLIAFSPAGVFVQCQKAAPKGVAGDDVWRPAARVGERGGTEPEGFNDLAFKSALGFDLSTSYSVADSWNTAVETYSGLEITHLEADRLIALSGVAKEFGAALAEREKEAGAGRAAQPDQKHRYVSGIWFGHPRGLLWEQVTPGRRVRVQGLPTWSWASMATLMHNDEGNEVLTGMAVQWSTPTRGYDKPAPVCEMVQARTVPVDVSKDADGRTVMTPLYHQATEEPPEDEFSKGHRFVMLGMKGRLLRVRVHREFESDADRGAAAALTGHKPDFGRDMWRGATTESEPDVVVGWASIEHPEWQDGDVQANAAHPEGGPDARLISQGEVVHAFFLTRIAKAKGGLGYGNWTGYQAVFKVLFLRPVDIPGFGTCYERLGTGRLFGNDVDAAFQGLQNAEGMVWLV